MQLNLQYEHIKTDFIFNSTSYTWMGDPPRYFNVRYPQNYVGRNVYIPEGTTYFRIWNANRFNGNVTFPNSINNLYAAFYNCYNFNSPVSFDDKIKWHSQVSDANWVIKDTSWMFANCFNFDSVVRFPTYNGERISDISSVNCYAMFANCYNMHGQIYNFHSYGENYADCFYNCHNLDQELYFGTWVYDNVLNLGGSSHSGKSYNANMFAMFSNCYKLKKIIMNIPLFQRAGDEDYGAYIAAGTNTYYGDWIFINRQYMFSNCFYLKKSPFSIFDFRQATYINTRSKSRGLYCWDLNFLIDADFVNRTKILDGNKYLSCFKGLFYNCKNLEIDSPFLLTGNNRLLYPYASLEDLCSDMNSFTEVSKRKMPYFNLNSINFDMSDIFFGINKYSTGGSLIWFDEFCNNINAHGSFAKINEYYICNETYIGTSTIPSKLYKGERFHKDGYASTYIGHANFIDLSGCFYGTNFLSVPSEISEYKVNDHRTIFGGFPFLNVHLDLPVSLETRVNVSSMFDNASFINVEPTSQFKTSNVYTRAEMSGINIEAETSLLIDEESGYKYIFDASSLFENFSLRISNNFRNKQRFIRPMANRVEYISNFSFFIYDRFTNYSQSTITDDIIKINVANFARNFTFNINEKLIYSVQNSNTSSLYLDSTFEIPYFYNDDSVPKSSDYNNILDFVKFKDIENISENIYLRPRILIKTYWNYSSFSSTRFTNAINYFRSKWLPIIGVPWSYFTNSGVVSFTGYYSLEYRYVYKNIIAYINFIHYNEGV